MQPPIIENTNLHPFSHCFPVIADYWSNFHIRQWDTCL